ncbi:MAG: DNA polymerase III subunit alpha, partial [Bradymonadaceae bacterium]
MSDFVHLHTHTQYSLLDGAIKIPDLMEKVDRLGMPAVAMTDHDNMYGAVDFQKAARDRGIKPIIGTEIATTGGEDFREASSPQSFHLTLLATSREGYFNLAKLSSAAWMEGFHERTETPRIDFDYLVENNEGLICLSGDLGSRVNQAILQEDLDEARRVARKYRDAFGEGNYYLELMRNGFPESETTSEALIELSDELDIPLVATNDCHYLEREEARAQAILMCIQLSKTVELDRLMEHGVDDLHFRSGEEMRELFSDVPQACDNTLEIAERCCDEPIPLGEIFLPQYDVPADFVEEEDLEEAGEDEIIHEYFVHKAYADLETRFEEFDEAGKDYDREAYRERLQDEIDIIREMDYPGYFLIVADFIQWAKDQDIPVGPGRGSGAGSLVAYAMRITDVDPMPYDLLFERFLNPERVSMPDFDIDFCMNRRGEVIDYVTDKYGENNVGQIITYGKMKARSVIRDVGRTLNFSYSETDRIAKLIPEDPGTTLDDALAQEPKLRNLIDRNERVEALFDIAQSLENVNRQAGIHAAGVVISDDPVWEEVPIKRGDDGEMVTQYAMEQVEEAGLVKFDFLGLKTLTVIDTAVQLVNDQRGPDEEKLDIDDISLEDEGIYELISSGETTGVFQLESEGFQGLLQRMRPETFEDVVAAVALYRPGPLGSGMVDDYIDRKHGRAEVEYPHPELEEVLEPTYGVMVYQEQVMQTAQIMAGYSLGEADLLRRAMGKKKEKV